jgi:hypothetical protein
LNGLCAIAGLERLEIGGNGNRTPAAFFLDVTVFLQKLAQFSVLTEQKLFLF